MSASPFPEPLDAPMHDFAEFDVPMNLASQDIFPELSMDHDGHNTTYTNQEGVEVDMETYDDENVEYEMADETFNESHYHHEPLDVEVYDASDARSPHPTPHSQPLQSLTANPEISLLSPLAPLSETFILQPATNPVEPPVTDRPVENDSPVAERPKLSPQQGDAPLALTFEQLPEPEPLHAVATDLAEAEPNVLPTVDPRDIEEDPALPVLGTTNEVGSSVEPTEAESALQPQAEDQPETLHLSNVPSESIVQAQGENLAEVHHEEADNDPHEISEGVYIDPPPAVFMSVGSSEVPEHCLFNQPLTDRGSRSPSAEATGSDGEAYSLLLQNRPTLYYEPLSSVFEALRQDDVIAKIPEALEGELVIDAYDLQLAISEDNIYAHEISLHDLNVLHDGSDFSGPLRIHLRSAIPRFILRYRLLQEQISRLNLAAGVAEESLEEEQHDDRHEQDNHDEKSQCEVSALDVQKDVDETEGVHQPEIHADEPQDEEAAATDTTTGATFIPQVSEGITYHPVGGEVSQALEEEGDYEGTNDGTDHNEGGEGNLDAAAVHETTDTDTATPTSSHNSRFGGEETGYLDYVQSEEYDYGEYFPEELEYHQTVGYEESEEQDASTTADNSKPVLPGSGLYEVDTTPVPPTQLVDSTPAQRSEIADSGPHEQADRLASHEPLETRSSYHTNKDKQADQHKSTTSQLPTDESDSNFLEMLEREADSELGHSSSDFNAKRIEKGGVGETVPALDEEWEWDDELDADGEADEEWLDPGDAVSNESSVTLSSSSSGKRGHDEVDPEEGEFEASTSQSSPGKRPRIH